HPGGTYREFLAFPRLSTRQLGSIGSRLVNDPYVSLDTGGSSMKVNRIRYQFGSLYLWKGVREEVWYYRYRDYDENGKRCQRNLKVGTLKQYPTETAAMRAVDSLWLSVNSGKPQPKPVTLRVVIERFEKEEM